jgi:phosphoserine phosphatase
MPNSLTWCDLPEDVSLWPGLPLSLSGDEVMPLDYHAGRSGWLLYGRGLDKRRLTAWQRELGAALVIVASWVVEDYQVIRLAGSLTLRATDWRMKRGWTSRRWGKFRICARRAAGDGYGLHGDSDRVH